jgi:hypothetical protein
MQFSTVLLFFIVFADYLSNCIEFWVKFSQVFFPESLPEYNFNTFKMQSSQESFAEKLGKP